MGELHWPVLRDNTAPTCSYGLSVAGDLLPLLGVSELRSPLYGFTFCLSSRLMSAMFLLTLGLSSPNAEYKLKTSSAT